MFKNNFLKKNEGFTLLELMGVVSILALTSLIVFNSFNNFRQNQSLSIGANKVTTFLQEARTKTISSKNNLTYGVHFEEFKITLFQGPVFILNNPNNVEVNLNSLVHLTSINLNGAGIDILFQRLTGVTNEYGTITISLQSQPLQNKTIQIGQTGIIEII